MNPILEFFSENFWASATALGAVATMIAGAVNGKFNPNKVWRQVIAWIISAGLTVGGYFLGIVSVAEPVWLTLTATGLVVGFVSNGIYDIPFMKSFIYKVFGELPTAKKE